VQKRLILGSSSPYRKALLQRLNLDFECISPNIDETALSNETPLAMVKRLAILKAQAITEQIITSNDTVIITSDQVACLDGQILGKPLTQENAIAQLTLFSGKKVDFITSLNLLNNNNGHTRLTTSRYSVYFRELTQTEIKGYIEIEQPLDCAGSFKCEGLGVALFDKMEGNDPNSLIGLPLIDLCKSLREFGINPLTD
jgi:MAF protein